MNGKVKVLLAILGIDVHNRGLITVAMELRDGLRMWVSKMRSCF
jgi:methylmalonyl-CoA mutase cobalamin-binding subunit